MKKLHEAQKKHGSRSRTRGKREEEPMLCKWRGVHFCLLKSRKRQTTSLKAATKHVLTTGGTTIPSDERERLTAGTPDQREKGKGSEIKEAASRNINPEGHWECQLTIKTECGEEKLMPRGRQKKKNVEVVNESNVMVLGGRTRKGRSRQFHIS